MTSLLIEGKPTLAPKNAETIDKLDRLLTYERPTNWSKNSDERIKFLGALEDLIDIQKSGKLRSLFASLEEKLDVNPELIEKNLLPGLLYISLNHEYLPDPIESIHGLVRSISSKSVIMNLEMLSQKIFTLLDHTPKKILLSNEYY